MTKSPSVATPWQIEDGRDISATFAAAMSKSLVEKSGAGRVESRAAHGAVKAACATSFIDTGVVAKRMAVRIVGQLNR